MRALNALSFSIALALAGNVWAESASTETKKAEAVATAALATSPQDGLTADEYKQITALLREKSVSTD